MKKIVRIRHVAYLFLALGGGGGGFSPAVPFPRPVGGGGGGLRPFWVGEGGFAPLLMSQVVHGEDDEKDDAENERGRSECVQPDCGLALSDLFGLLVDLAHHVQDRVLTC
jgi:hypothetical protein